MTTNFNISFYVVFHAYMFILCYLTIVKKRGYYKTSPPFVGRNVPCKEQKQESNDIQTKNNYLKSFTLYPTCVGF